MKACISKKINTINISTILMIVVLIFCNISTVIAETNQKTPYENFKDNLPSQMKALMDKYDVPGANVVLIHEGRIDCLESFGITDKKLKTEVKADTLFQVASISKSVTAWGVMKLVEAGKLDLDVPVSTYLKSYNLPESEFDNSKITIRALLSHTSGLAKTTYPGYHPDITLPSLEEVLNGKNGIKYVKESGEEFIYSGTGYVILQKVIEDITGETFAAFMEREVLKPLNMTHSTFEYFTELDKTLAKPYGVFGRELPNYIYTEKAAAGLYTTAEDLAKFVVAGLDGSVSGRAILSQEMTDTIYTPIKGNYGLGCSINELTNKISTVSHRGDNRGWASGYMFIRSTGEGLIILTNSENGNNLLWDMIDSWTTMNAGEKQPYYIKRFKLKETLLMAAGTMIALLALYLVFFVISLIKGRRIFLLKYKKGIRFKILPMAIPVLIFTLFYVFVYTGTFYGGFVPSTRIPYGVNYIAISLGLWCSSLFIIAFFPKVKAQKREGLDEKL